MLKKKTPLDNSYKEIILGLYSLAYFPLITENNMDKKAEVTAK